jgi:hypothetical protein
MIILHRNVLFGDYIAKTPLFLRGIYTISAPGEL